jgi:hypothetical protein
LVSTISFSGLERMDYSLAGNNVLKDHSWPTSCFLVKGGDGKLGGLRIPAGSSKIRLGLQV